MSKDEAGDPGVGMVLEDEETADSAPLAGRFGSLRAANQDRYADRHGADVVAHSGPVAWPQAGPSRENYARREAMTAIHLPPGDARHHPIDGEHVARAGSHGPSGPFEDGAGRFVADFAGAVPRGQPVEESMEAIRSVPQRRGLSLAGG